MSLPEEGEGELGRFPYPERLYLVLIVAIGGRGVLGVMPEYRQDGEAEGQESNRVVRFKLGRDSQRPFDQRDTTLDSHSGNLGLAALLFGFLLG